MAECCNERKKERKKDGKKERKKEKKKEGKKERKKEGRKERMNEQILLETSWPHIHRMPDPIPQLCRMLAICINISVIKFQFK